MVQMSSAEQAIIKALPGNDRCMECGMKSPQWASVSFGTVFCLECSGVHRSLGVHISFVRSIAMDSWTEPQLKLMKSGGNKKCETFITAGGVSKDTPIKAKYESPVAQHYKEVLKAKANGLPEPVYKAPVRTTSNFTSTASSTAAPGEDVNGMERLTGESDEQYVARQTRLRAEAKVRMAAKFGNNGGMMGGVGSGGGGAMGRKPMAGIGSDSSYNPNQGGYGGGNGNAPDINVDAIMSGLGNAFSTLGQYGRSGIQTASAALQDQERMNSLGQNVRTTGMGLWGTFSAAASDLAKTITEPEDDGISGLRAHVQQEQMSKGRPTPSSYEGFGSNNTSWNSQPSSSTANGSNNNNSFSNKKNDSASKMKVDANNSDDFFSSFGA